MGSTRTQDTPLSDPQVRALALLAEHGSLSQGNDHGIILSTVLHLQRRGLCDLERTTVYRRGVRHRAWTATHIPNP